MTEPAKAETPETEDANIPVFDLNVHIHRLLMDEPFFAALSRRMDKRATNAIPTAGVMVTEEGKLEMVYNPEFFAGLTDPQRRTFLSTSSITLFFSMLLVVALLPSVI